MTSRRAYEGSEIGFEANPAFVLRTMPVFAVMALRASIRAMR